MAIVKTFRCVRPNPAAAPLVAALPYDVYSRKEAKAVVKDNPLSFLNIDRAETQFSDDVDTYDERVYRKAKELLDARIADKTLIEDSEYCYYIYELTMNGRSQAGIVAGSSVDDYLNGIVKKHENTRKDKELDRIRHVDVTNAQTGPIFLAYRSNAAINQIMAHVMEWETLYDFTSDDGVRHRVWRIADQELTEKIEEAFKRVPYTYIADGHHRAASAIQVACKRRKEAKEDSSRQPYDSFLSVLFPDDQLEILSYNRVVKDLNGMTADDFLLRLLTLKEFSSIRCMGDVPYSPTEKGTFGMYLAGSWYALSICDECRTLDPVDGLDVSLLQNYILGPVLGIGDPRVDKRIDFIGGIRGLEELKRRVDDGMRVAFSMYPTSMTELFQVADAGLLMPPKSTWFEPKLRSGLFIHKLSQ